MKKELFNLTVLARNNWNILNRLTAIFSKRRLEIRGHSSSESTEKDIHQFYFEFFSTSEEMEKLRKLIQKQIDVSEVHYAIIDNQISREIALYMLSSSNLFDKTLKKTISSNQASIVDITKDFLIIEKKGNHQQTEKLFQELYPFGLLQFSRSGSAAILTQDHK